MLDRIDRTLSRIETALAVGSCAVIVVIFVLVIIDVTVRTLGFTPPGFTIAVVEYGLGAGDLGSFMAPGQVFVFAIVTSISIPCAATLAALVAELGRRPALAISGGSLVLALAAGGLIARILGIA